MEESPQKLRQASAYNPTQGAPSLRATTTTPGAGPPARPLRPSAARTPGRRSEEEEDEEEPTVAQDVAPQVHQTSNRSIGLLVALTLPLGLSLWRGVGWVCDGQLCSGVTRRKRTAQRHTHAVQSRPLLHSYGQRHQLPPLRRQRSQRRDFGRPC